MTRKLVSLSILTLALLSADRPAEGACPGTFSVPLGDASACDCNPPANTCKQGCRTYDCASGALTGWQPSPQCAIVACGEDCADPAPECIDLCGADGRDEDGDGVASDGCEVWGSPCTVPGGCQAQDGTSISRGSVRLPEPADWSLFRVGEPLSFRRVYVSQLWRAYTPTAGARTVLGPNWWSTYMAGIEQPGGGANPAFVALEDAREVRFTSTGLQGPCVAGAKEFVPSPGHYVEQLCKLSDGTWELRELSGRRLLFNATGQVTEFRAKEDTDADKLRVTVTWATINGTLLATKAELWVGNDAAASDRLTFGYSSTNLLTSVTHAASGLSTTYSYGAGNGQQARLTKVTFPGGAVREYVYSNAAGTEGFLTQVKDETAKVLHQIDWKANTFGIAEHEITVAGEAAYRYDHASCGAGQTEVLWNKCADGSCNADCAPNCRRTARRTAIARRILRRR